MSSETGGRADKLGNEFERLWAVRHLVELVEGRAAYVEIEPSGEDERGTDFWVGRPSGTREAHQCKRENGARGDWSAADLQARRVITDAAFQLGRNPSHHFFFVSGDKAPYLHDLTERARRCEAADLRSDPVLTPPEHRREFRNVCKYLGLDPDKPEEQWAVWDFLRRFHCRIKDKEGLRDEVEELAHRWVDGDPKEAVAALADLAEKSIGRRLRPGDVIAHLPPHLRPRDLAKDPRLHTRMGGLRERFSSSYRDMLIGGVTLSRTETDQLLGMLKAPDGPRLILVHGSGGQGKTGVAYELLGRLAEAGIVFLPLRLDRDTPAGSPLQYGRQLDLPASPAACLLAEADGRPAVLLLDQLDAVRWTAAHSAHAWDTVERLVAEAGLHTNLRVVVVCRSFDLNDDRRIRAWKERAKAVEFKVGPLDDATVDRVVSGAGASPASIDSRQREVLRSPQGLYLWRALHDSGARPPAFRTLTDLMRAFWVHVRREKLPGLREGRYDAALDALVEYMDRRGALVAPRSVVAKWENEVAALLSLNVLTEQPPASLMFAHQSYLDFLTAERVLLEVHSGAGSVIDWLRRDPEQSLFRRGQLRQLLTLLRDEDPALYAAALRSILTEKDVRFHLRHLALQMLGQAEPPIKAEVDLVLDLANEDVWLDHVVSQVLAGRAAWFDALNERGVLRGWLGGPDVRRRNYALHLMERSVQQRGDAVASLLLDRAGEPLKPEQLEAVLGHTPPELLTARLFDVYRRLVTRRSTSLQYVNWKPLAEADPERFVRLLAAFLRRHERVRRMGPAGSRKSSDDKSLLVGETLEAARKAVAAVPVLAWDLLTPYFRRAAREGVAVRREMRRGGMGAFRDLFERRERLRDVRHLLRATLTAAGTALAATVPDTLWERVQRLGGVRAKSVNRVLARCIAAGPDGRADDAIQWLLSEPSRLRCGAGGRGAVYRPARRLMRRYAGTCADPVFARLLSRVLSYKSEEEMADFRYRHSLLMDKSRGQNAAFDLLSDNELGLGQHLLLSALPKRRLTAAARDRAGVLRRKFGPPRAWLKGRPGRSGGVAYSVVSVIPPERLHLLSDRDWLRIVHGRWPASSTRRKPMGPGLVGRPAVEFFARDLGQMAHREPQRFARLALRMRSDVDPRYPVAILRAFRETKAPENDPKAAGWRPVTPEQVEELAAYFDPLLSNNEVAMAVCWVVQELEGAAWSDAMVSRIARLASEHPDPPPGKFALSHVTTDKETGRRENTPDVPGTALNCVRGVAGLAVRALLFDQPDKLPLLCPAIDALVADPHPSVRVGSFAPALPLLNIDRELAVATFVRACGHPDDRVFLAHDVDHFLSYTLLTHLEPLRPVVERMVASPVEEVSKKGAAWATLAWVHNGTLADVVERCRAGGVPQRHGLAEVLARSAPEDRGGDEAAAVLASLFDDEPHGVRDAAAAVFRHDGVFGRPQSLRLVEAFIRSKAFDGNIDDLLWGVDHFTGSLLGYTGVLQALVDRFVTPPAGGPEAWRRRSFDTGTLAKILLRLYEQADQDRALRQQCLGAWDRLLEDGAWFDVLKHIDG